MKAASIPPVYPFENPSLAAGLAAINATTSLSKTEAKHLETWFKEVREPCEIVQTTEGGM